MLFSLEPAVICVLLDGFILAPLPARKQLWEAQNEQTWLLERSKDITAPKLFGVKENGDMVRLNEQQSVFSSEMASVAPELPTESTANWQEWCAGMDGLGALIMLAASLPR